MNPARTAQELQAALAHHQAGRLAAAEEGYARVRAAAPRNFDAAHLAGTVQLQQGRAAEAGATLALARRLDPSSAVCAMRLGVARSALGQFAAAAEVLAAAVKLDPGLPEGWFHLSRALAQLGRPAEAEAAVRRAIALRPDEAEAHEHLGALLTLTQGHAAAEPLLRRATELQPGFARAWCNLGISLVYLGRLSAAVDCFGRALGLDPRLHHAYAGRGLALERAHRLKEAVADYERAIAGDPSNHQVRSARLMALHYLGDVSAAQLAEEHRRFGDAIAASVPAQEARGADRPAGRGRIRVGFLSPNLRAHSVAHFLEPLLEHLDRSRFELFLYHDHAVTDATSERLRRMAAQWRQVAGLPAAALEAVLRGDQLDILVDLAGHTELNRLPLLGRRLAPVQATYLGYPNTTGLRTMDYRLVDAVTDPVGEADDRCTERLLRFAPTAWCYAPPADAPLPAPGPVARGAGIAFGCFNNFSKVTDEMLMVWSRILAAVPGSRLVLKGFGLGEGALRSAALARAAAAGIDLGRLELLGRTVGQAEHLAAYARVDVSLDTFPYHGTTTTCEALWMGVPVVTLAGDRHASRVGASLLKAVGRDEWIAHDWNGYVAVAVALAADSAQLAGWRAELRGEFRRSALFDHAGQSARLGAALDEMWQSRPLDLPHAGRRSA